MPAPLTGFEQRGRTLPWTTVEEEAAFLENLVAYADEMPGAPPVRMEEVGQSVQGKPIRLVRIGTGSRRILHVGLQHGNEEAGREALLTMMRQIVESADPALRSYLSQVTVAILPTANPDRMGWRLNANGENINRDHLALTQPETRAIHVAIRDVQPDMFIDWHEYTEPFDVQYQTGPARNVNIAPELLGWAETLHHEVGAAVTAAGWGWSEYAPSYGPEYGRSAGGLRGAVALLLESDANLDPIPRHDMHLISAETVWRWHHARVSTIARAVDNARAWAATTTAPIRFQRGGDSGGDWLDPVPSGYFVTPSMWESLAPQRAIFGIRGNAVSGGYYIPTAQAMRVLIAYLMDPQSPRAIVAGTRMDAPPPSSTPVPIGREVSFFYRLNGRTRPVTLKVKP